MVLKKKKRIIIFFKTSPILCYMIYMSVIMTLHSPLFIKFKNKSSGSVGERLKQPQIDSIIPIHVLIAIDAVV